MFKQQHPFRVVFVFFFIILVFFIFSLRLVLIQFFRSEYLADLANKQHDSLIKLEPKRGIIFDRKLRPLAFNETVYSLSASPRDMSDGDKAKVFDNLSALEAFDPDLIKERLNRDKKFVWLARKLPTATYKKIKEMKLKGLLFIKEAKRYYPNGYLGSHVIGFAGLDNIGLEGLELYYNKHLQGEAGWTRILKDARKKELLLESDTIPPRDGFDLVLTIDETIQYITERALDKAMKKNNAKGATIIVLQPKTGEVLALANRPTFDLSKMFQSSTASRTNRALAYVYEPGSVFKIIAAAAALEEGIFNEKDQIYCEQGEYRVANHILHDHRPHGKLTFQEVFELSSNIGVAKIAQKLGPERVYQYARKFRIGVKTGVNLPGETNGLLKTPSRWSKTTIGAIPIGHEVTTTPMQMICAMATIANDGVFMKPYVVKRIKDQDDLDIETFSPQVVDRVVTEKTAKRVKAILQGVVDGGTGIRAKIRGLSVAGKTGTSQKVIDGVYSHSKFFSSFAGFAPVEDPKLAVIVVFDEAHPSYFGGTVAAPVFKEIVQDSLKYFDSTEDVDLPTAEQ